MSVDRLGSGHQENRECAGPSGAFAASGRAARRQIGSFIKMRYLQDQTQAEVARNLGVSQVQVSRLEKKILREMRKHFKEENAVDHGA